MSLSCKRELTCLVCSHGWPGANNSSKMHPALQRGSGLLPRWQRCHGSTHEWHTDYSSGRDWRRKENEHRCLIPGQPGKPQRPNGDSQAIRPASLAAVLPARPQLSSGQTVLQATLNFTTPLHTNPRLERHLQGLRGPQCILEPEDCLRLAAPFALNTLHTSESCFHLPFVAIRVHCSKWVSQLILLAPYRHTPADKVLRFPRLRQLPTDISRYNDHIVIAFLSNVRSLHPSRALTSPG
jgi:hypothetical protein